MKLTVIGGGGWVGSATAFHIAALGLATEVVLIGSRPEKVEQHALDMSAAFAAAGVRVTAGDYPDMAGSDVVIQTAGVPHTGDRAAMLAANTALVSHIARQIRTHCPEALVVTATNPLDPLNYATWRAGGFARRQVIGYSLNDSFRFRQAVAAARGVPPGQVEGYVVGEHGPAQVLLFSTVRIDGAPVTFSEAEKQAIRAVRPEAFKRVEVLQKLTGRTAGWTCAVGLAALTAAIVGDTGEVFPCSAVLDGEYGLHGLSVGVPVKIGRMGIQEILEWDLALDERTALSECARQLQAAAALVDQSLVAADA